MKKLDSTTNKRESKPMTKRTAYIYFIFCIIFEQCGNFVLAYTDGFTDPLPTLWCIVTYGLCYFCFAKSLKVLNLAVGYAVWAGISMIIVAGISVFMLHLQLNWADYGEQEMTKITDVVISHTRAFLNLYKKK